MGGVENFKRPTGCAQVFEQEKLVEISREEISELVLKDRVYRVDGGFAFKQAGVYTTNHRIFVVLPWICRDFEKTKQIYDTIDDASLMLDAFFDLKRVIAKAQVATTDIETGRDFVLYGYMQELASLVEIGIKNNVFRSLTDSRSAIQGKWLIAKDISQTETPTSFTCEVSECDKNHPLLMLAREYAYQVGQNCQSVRLRNLANALERKLSFHADVAENIHSTVRQAKQMASTDKRFKIWAPWIEAIHWFLEIETGRSIHSIAKAGSISDIEFPSPRLFEIVTAKLLRKIGYNVKEQVSGKILGGSSWVGKNQIEEERSEFSNDIFSTAASTSRPDMLATRQGQVPFLFECKYKQLEIDAGEAVPRIKGLNRNDRNQLLSFVMSISVESRFNTNSIFLVWPSRNCANTAVPELRFATRFEFVGTSPTLKWSANFLNSSNLKVRFLTYDLVRILGELSGKREPKELTRIAEILEVHKLMDISPAI